MANIFTRIYDALFKAPEVTTSKTTKITGYEQYGYPYLTSEMKKTEYLQELRGWVAACVTAIADEIASIELKLLKFEDGDIEEIDDHPIIDLLYKVNEYTTRFDHFWITQVYLELTGEAPWYIEKTGKNIDAIYFLRPDKLTPVTDRTSKLISGYKYDVGMGKSVPLTLDEVIFLKYPDPMNPFRGKGTLEMAARIVDVDNFSEDWNKAFYKNAAKPDSVLKVKTDTMTDEQRARLKQSLKEQYEGVEKAHQTMVLFGDMEWQQIGVNQKDMDFLEQQKFSRDKILGIFRVPKAVIAQTEGVNLASAQVAQYTFAKWCIKPKIERLVQQLNEFLIPNFEKSEALYLDYDEIVPQDVTTALARYQNGLQNGWLTVNEVREMENLEPIESDVVAGTPKPTEVPEEPVAASKPGEPTKTIKINKGRLHEIRSRNRRYFEIQKQKKEFLTSVEQLILKEVKRKKLESKKLKARNKDIDTGEIIESVIQPKLTTAEEKTAFWQMKDLLYSKYYPSLRDALGKVFQEQYKVVVSKLLKIKTITKAEETGSHIYDKIKLSGPIESTRVLRETIVLLEELFKESGTKTYEALGIDSSMSPKREEIQELIQDYGREFAKSMTDTTNEAIKRRVYENFSNGGTLSDLKNNLREYFDSSEQYRADRIARTETIRYSTSATEQAFIDSGVVQAKQWFVNPDACAICQPMSGKTIDLGENFFNLGDKVTGIDGKEFSIDYTAVQSPPLHVNCRCDLIPVWYNSSTKADFKRLDITGEDTDIERVRDVDNNVTRHIRSKGKLDIKQTEEESLEKYVSTEYWNINRYLRFDKVDDIDKKIEIERAITEVSRIIDKNKIDEDYIVFRGAALELSEKKLYSTFKVGSEMIDKGFVSTSFSEYKALEFAHDIWERSDIKNPTPVVFRIKVPKNASAAIPFRSKVGISHEYEVLLNKDSSFIIENIVKQEGKGTRKDSYYIDLLYKGISKKQLSNIETKVSKKRVISDISRFVWTLNDFEIVK